MEWTLLIILSAILVSISDIVRKKKSKDIKSYHLLFYTIAFAVFFFLILFHDKLIYQFPINLWILFIFKGLLLTIAGILMFQAIKQFELSYISPMRNLSIIATIILSYFILSESITIKQGFGIFILIISSYLMELDPATHKFEGFKNGFYLIFAWFFFVALLPIIDKYLLTQLSIYNAWFFPMVITLIALILIIFIQKEFSIIKHSLKKNWMIFSTLGGLFLFDTFLWFTAIAKPNALISLAIPLRRTSNFFNTIFGGRIFHEKHLVYRGLICFLMIIGIFLII